jgi:hypothetical protein
VPAVHTTDPSVTVPLVGHAGVVIPLVPAVVQVNPYFVLEIVMMSRSPTD